MSHFSSFLDISNILLPSIPDSRMIKSLISYLQTNISLDYRKVLQEGKDLKSLNPQILCNLEKLLEKEVFWPELKNNSPDFIMNLESLIEKETLRLERPTNFEKETFRSEIQPNIEKKLFNSENTSLTPQILLNFAEKEAIKVEHRENSLPVTSFTSMNCGFTCESKFEENYSEKESPEKESKESLLDSQKKKWWTPKEVSLDYYLKIYLFFNNK